MAVMDEFAKTHAMTWASQYFNNTDKAVAFVNYLCELPKDELEYVMANGYRAHAEEFERNWNIEH